MSNTLTDKTMVLVTFVGPVWVTRERGEMAMKIKEQDPNAVIEIDESYYGANQIRALLSAQQYAEFQYEKRGMWQCPYQKWHAKFDNCEHAREVRHDPRPEPPEMTDEERARASAKLDEIRKKFNFGKKKV